MSDTIASVLLPLLRRNFSDKDFRVHPECSSLAVFPAIHPDVGDIEIYDDDDELTLVLGNFTHVHFSNDDEDITETERKKLISDDAVSFLVEVFSDQVEFFGSHLGGGGVRNRGDGKRGSLSRIVFGGKSYVWSGPLENNAK